MVVILATDVDFQASAFVVTIFIGVIKDEKETPIMGDVLHGKEGPFAWDDRRYLQSVV